MAAATAAFIADVRVPEGPDRERLTFFAQQLLGRVARRHADVEDQAQFDHWIARLELNDPGARLKQPVVQDLGAAASRGRRLLGLLQGCFRPALLELHILQLPA